jgi:hypothetical protein
VGKKYSTFEVEALVVVVHHAIIESFDIRRDVKESLIRPAKEEEIAGAVGSTGAESLMLRTQELKVPFPRFLAV